MSAQPAINLELHPRQIDAFTSAATEILYGGAAGGGKSHLMRVVAITWCTEIPGLQCYLFRRLLPDLEKNHMEGPKGFRNMLAPWVQAGFVKITEKKIEFWNGSIIWLCHCKDEDDRYNYQGAEIHALLIDELTHFSEVIYRFLRSRLRQVGMGMNVPAHHQGRFPRILCSSNPGNLGHLWVKTGWIDDALPMQLRRMPDEEGGLLRQYIPALLDDNPSLAEDDPSYRARLRGLGSEALVRAMEKGDWSVVEGAYFDCWLPARHVIEPFVIPAHWTRLVSLDWGSARPFSVGWWAIVSEPFQTPDGRILPRNAMVRYREWYGKRSPNVGLKMDAEDVGKGIATRTPKGESIAYYVGDPSIRKQDGGPSIAERMYRATDCTVAFQGGDNQRLPGWDQMRARLKGEDDKPMIYCFSTCFDSIRTIPTLQHDNIKPEDVDSDGEDHAADEWRYACMSRPYTAATPPDPEAPRPPIKGWESLTLDQLWKEKRARREWVRI